ncbi:MAG: hypothetical protein J6B80_06025 [Clostridia bacterium]|nr:hypothetical protein [Clostridia bacterium]
MKKISQGEYQLLTTKADAIDKLMQMQGVCREEISGENAIQFYCLKNGKITIINPPTRRVENDNSTILFGRVIEKDGKTYVTYYTAFSKSNNVTKLIFLLMDFLMAAISIVYVVLSKTQMYYLPILILALPLFSFKFFVGTKEEKNSKTDSEILIKELEKRVEAVNYWDK